MSFRARWLPSFEAVLATLVALALFAEAPGVFAAPRGAVSGQVSVTKGGDKKSDASGVVVYVTGPKDALPKGTSAHKVRQKDKQFDPSLTIVLKGETVEFPNEDKIHHNVFSVSKPARFDLGLYKAGSSKSVKMKKAGVVDVYCNIHPEMVAKILVLDTKYFAVTGNDGKFSIDGLPAGTWKIIAWHPHGKQWEGTVTVTGGATASVDITVEAGESKSRHARKDGTPYGRYK